MVMLLIVYADILIIVNFIVDYFLILLTGRILKRKPSVLRGVLAALFAAASTLTIFLPEPGAAAEILIKAAVAVGVCLIAFGYVSLRRLALSSLVFTAVTVCYAGAMLALWYIVKPKGMFIKNSVVYFDVSPAFLIAFSVAGFLIFSLLSSLLARKNSKAKDCFVTLVFCDKTADFSGVIDSGNSLSDPFDGSAVVVVDPGKCAAAFGELSPERRPERYRAVPCSTVLGNVLLDGFRCERGVIATEEKTVRLVRPIMAISKTPLCDCEAIVNPSDCD